MNIDRYIGVTGMMLMLALSTLVHGQSVIRGKVVDATNNEGLPGANVQVAGTVVGTSTSLSGEFEIPRLPYGRYRIIVTMIGYKKAEMEVAVTANQGPEILIQLDEAPIEIEPVVVTVSKWQEEAEKTSATVEVLTARDIMNRNPIRIEDALETAAGVQIVQENVNIRGSDGFTWGIGSRVLVMLDGIPVMNSDMGAVNWFMISPADIERAEIVRGAGSAIYGSSAMGGVINFITRRPSPKSQTYVRAMFGVYDDFHEPGWNWAARADSVLHFNRQDFTHSRQIGKWGLRVSGGRSYSTGYTDHNKFARYNFSGKVDYRFANASKLTLFGNYLHDESDVFVIWKNQSEASRVEPNQANKEQDRNGITLYASYNMVLSSKAALEFRAYLNRFLMGIQFEDFNFAPAQGLGGSIQGNFLASESFSFTYGSDFKFDKVRSDSVYGERDAILVAPYFQADWRPVSRLGFTVGGRYDRYEVYSDTKYRIIKGRRFEHFSPKFGLNYQPFDKTVVRASVSNGFKFPVIFQMFFEETIAEIPIQVNPALDSEESWSYEIGLRHRFSDSWFVEANAFYTDVNGLIELGVNSSNGTANFVNLTDVIIPGFELTTNGRWWENRLGLRANFTYLNPEDRVTHQLLRHRQKYIAFLQGSYRKGDTEFQLDYKYASAQEHYLLPGIHQFVPQKVWDARILFYWGDYTFMVGVNNLANYSYTLRDKVLEENRNFFVGLSSEF